MNIQNKQLSRAETEENCAGTRNRRNLSFQQTFLGVLNADEVNRAVFVDMLQHY